MNKPAQLSALDDMTCDEIVARDDVLSSEAGAIAGDRAASLRPRLNSSVRWLTWNPAIAEDAVSEVVLARLANDDEAHPIRNHDAWALAVLRNKVTDELRQFGQEGWLRHKAERCGEFALIEQLPDRSQDPYTAVRALRFAEDVAQALEILSPVHRAIFVRSAVMGEALSDLGVEFGVSSNNAAVICCRVRQKLQRALVSWAPD